MIERLLRLILNKNGRELDRQVQMPDDNFVFDKIPDFSSDLVSAKWSGVC